MAIFPSSSQSTSIKKRLQGILTHGAALPKGAREHAAGNPMGYPGCKKAKVCFISVLGKSNLLKQESHCSLAINNVPFRTRRTGKEVFREMHIPTSLLVTSFSPVKRFTWWTLTNICRVNPDYYFCCSTKPTFFSLGISTITVLEVKVLNFTFHAKFQFLWTQPLLWAASLSTHDITALKYNWNKVKIKVDLFGSCHCVL